jgi:hypothetical protein
VEALLARLQRNAVICCAVFTVLAVAVSRDWRYAPAVLGGGLLIGVSFLSIRGGLEGLMGGGGVARALVKVAGRYALLGFLAYVMIARLRLPPLGLIAGASSIAAAAVLEAARRPRNHQKHSSQPH